MSQIQTNQCLHCNQNKEGLTFQVPVIDTNPPNITTKHYCWSNLESLLKEELDICREWERNKKKLFREAITKCQKRETFEWPWRERVNTGTSPWDRPSVVCSQCKVKLFWDVTVYDDSRGHLCSYCSNCNDFIKNHEKRNEHYTWNEDALPVYKCKKRELTRPSKYFKLAHCMGCDMALLQEEKNKVNFVSDNGSVFSYVHQRSNAKGHCVAMTKRHLNNFREMDKQEWNDILSCLKETTRKIDKVYPNMGHILTIPIGKEGSPNPPHFYMRIVPKYKKDYGWVACRYYREYSENIPSSLTREKILSALKPNADNIIAEKSKVTARLNSRNIFEHIFITTKEPLPNDINAIDQETWAQFGEVIQELMQNIEGKIGVEGFVVACTVGKEAAEALNNERQEGEIPLDDDYLQTSQFQIRLFPKYNKADQLEWGAWGGRRGRPKKEKKPIGSMENERIAEKLRTPEAYYAKWKGDRDYLKHKAEREREQNWLKALNLRGNWICGRSNDGRNIDLCD